MYSTQILADGGSGHREDRATGGSNTLGGLGIHLETVMPASSVAHRPAAGEQRRLDVAVPLDEILPIGRPVRRAAVLALGADEVHVAGPDGLALAAAVGFGHIVVEHLAQREIDAPCI